MTLTTLAQALMVSVVVAVVLVTWWEQAQERRERGMTK